MISQLLIWLYMALFLLGLGLLGRNLITAIVDKKGKVPDGGPIYLILFGFLILHTILGYFSLFVPIGRTVHLGLLLVSLSGIFFNYDYLKGIINRVGNELLSLPIYIVLPPLIFLISILVNSTFSFNHYDTGLYYLQNIQWIEKYPVVKGLANLHSRFGFNSHFFIDSSFFKMSFLGLRGGNVDIFFYPVNSFMYSLLIVKIAVNLGKYFREKSWYLFSVNFAFLYFSYTVVATFMSNPTPDVITVVLIGFLVIYILDQKEFKGVTKDFILTSLLVFTIITIKISNVFLVILFLIFIVRFKLKGLAYLSVIGLVVLAPFFIRNIILSGYLVYPLAAVDIFSFDWKIPIGNVKSEYNWIKSWAIMPGKTPDEVFAIPVSEWFMEWYNRQHESSRQLLFLAPFSIISLFIRKGNGLVHRFLLISFIFSIGYWFLGAPNPRFVWGILAGMISLTIGSLVALIPKHRILKLAMAIIVIYISFYEVWIPGRRFKNLTDFQKHYPYQPPPIEVISKELNGFVVKVPVKGNRCFDEPLPCTVPKVKEKITMRGETLKEGFNPR